VVESNISSGQLGSFVDLAMKAKGQEIKRLTIGPPDFDASFSTVPNFDQIHDRVRKLLASASSESPAAAPEDTLLLPGSVPGTGLSAAGLPAGLPATTPSPSPSSASDFTPVTTTPEGEPITEAMLNQFKREGNEQAIRDLVATNGQCAPL
jgi:hypothetical protein